MLRRLSSKSDPVQNARELKRHVLRLYKVIHPDRLGRYPKQRAINEESFQVLQSALDRHYDRVAARTRDIPPEAPQRPRNLTFYAHNHARKLEHRDKAVYGKDLTKTVVEFHETRLGHALHSLFKSLGLEPPPGNVLPGILHGSGTVLEFATLTELVKHARKVSMASIKKKHTAASEQAAETEDGEREISVTRQALMRSRGISFVLGGGLPGREKLVPVFRRLGAMICELRRVDLHNVVIELDGGNKIGVNRTGVFPWLKFGICSSEETWQTALQCDELADSVRGSGELVWRLRKGEAVAAKVLGVRLVLHDIPLLKQDDDIKANGKDALEIMLEGSRYVRQYLAMLDGIVASNGGKDSRYHGSRRVEGVSAVALMFKVGHEIEADYDEGVLRIGIDVEEEDVRQTLRKHGRSVNDEYTRRSQERRKEESSIDVAKRALGIPSLRRLEEVSDLDWLKALAKLKEDARRLRGVFDRTPVVVGTRARILISSGEIEIPYDFYESLPI